MFDPVLADIGTKELAGGVVTALLAGTGIKAVLDGRKVEPEREAISTKTMVEVNDEQRKVIARQAEEIEKRDNLIDTLETRLTSLAVEIERLQAEVAALRAP